ncbi:MAG: putative sugar kinase [Bacteroidetes bacterium]|jgi:NAD+ kinase|nr:putative sugar kinase [Bacteroidota bacterium]MDF2450692.1 putative sugar kinase [Bacteroidota bacterium]
MTIAVYARNTKDNFPDYLEHLLAVSISEKFNVIVYKPYLDFLNQTLGRTFATTTFSSSEELIAKADYVISLGGDGTMLETLEFVRRSGIPVLGVNTGRLGFLATVYKEDFEKAIQLLINEKFTLDKRELIELDKTTCFNEVNYALNEFTIHKKESSAMINIDTYVNGIFLNSYFADGLIVSTPTGSTAYSLSCGGPIMVPDSDNFIITPIAPHNLNVRPIVISNNKTISFKVSGRSDSFNVSLDSRSQTIKNLSELVIKKADFRFNMINLEGQHFFETLRNKLLWGIDKRH